MADKSKRVLIPRKYRKNPCVAEYQYLKANKFDNVPVEDDTTILFSTIAKFGEYSVLYQTWYWSGIEAESLIFANSDITNITMDELMEQVRNSPLIKDSSEAITSSSKSEFTFFNFNFTIDD